MDSLFTTVKNIAEGIKTIAPGLALLAIIIIGLLWMFAKDPNKKESLVSWLTNVVIGFVLVYGAASLITWLGTKTSGYSTGSDSSMIVPGQNAATLSDYAIYIPDSNTSTIENKG